MKEEILNKAYINAKDLQVITGFGRDTCRKLIKEVAEEMESKNLYIPETKSKLVLTKMVRKKLGI